MRPLKEEYDFFKGERGNFFRDGAKLHLHLPIYLEPDTLAFFESIAMRKKLDIFKVCDDLIKKDMQIAECTKQLPSIIPP